MPHFRTGALVFQTSGKGGVRADKASKTIRKGKCLLENVRLMNMLDTEMRTTADGRQLYCKQIDDPFYPGGGQDQEKL
jgi:hypothetical protein